MPRIIVLVDESGSMFSQRHEVIDGINTMINQQKKQQISDIMIDVVKFNTGVCHYVSNKLSKVPAFTHKDYNPNGGTALYDAVGFTINKYQNEAGVTMIVTTDGMENSSKEYKREDMVKLIENQQNQKDWNFIYLSEDPTTVRQGYGMGFVNNNRGCSNVYIGKNQTGTQLGTESLNTYLGQCSQGMTKMNYQAWQNKCYKK